MLHGFNECAFLLKGNECNNRGYVQIISVCRWPESFQNASCKFGKSLNKYVKYVNKQVGTSSSQSIKVCHCSMYVFVHNSILVYTTHRCSAPSIFSALRLDFRFKGQVSSIYLQHTFTWPLEQTKQPSATRQIFLKGLSTGWSSCIEVPLVIPHPHFSVKSNRQGGCAPASKQQLPIVFSFLYLGRDSLLNFSSKNYF